jgi:hypothetical protein
MTERFLQPNCSVNGQNGSSLQSEFVSTTAVWDQ